MGMNFLMDHGADDDFNAEQIIFQCFKVLNHVLYSL